MSMDVLVWIYILTVPSSSSIQHNTKQQYFNHLRWKWGCEYSCIDILCVIVYTFKVYCFRTLQHCKIKSNIQNAVHVESEEFETKLCVCVYVYFCLFVQVIITQHLQRTCAYEWAFCLHSDKSTTTTTVKHRREKQSGYRAEQFHRFPVSKKVINLCRQAKIEKHVPSWWWWEMHM